MQIRWRHTKNNLPLQLKYDEFRLIVSSLLITSRIIWPIFEKPIQTYITIGVRSMNSTLREPRRINSHFIFNLIIGTLLIAFYWIKIQILLYGSLKKKIVLDMCHVKYKIVILSAQSAKHEEQFTIFLTIV